MFVHAGVSVYGTHADVNAYMNSVLGNLEA